MEKRLNLSAPHKFVLGGVVLLQVVTLAVCVHTGVVATFNGKEIARQSATVIGMQRKSERLLLDHMKRTVERWERLQKENPSLRIHQIPEPLAVAPAADSPTP